MKQVFLNKREQAHLKPALTLALKTCVVLVSTCWVPQLRRRDARNIKHYYNMAKIKCEVVWYTEEKGNCKAAAIFELMKATVHCDRNIRRRSPRVRHYERKSLDPIKDDFCELMMQCCILFKRDTKLE
jgi:hypothetical protein